MGNLKEQGWRLLVNKALEDVRWIHPDDVKSMTGYVDCTDMDDAKFESFMRLVAV